MTDLPHTPQLAVTECTEGTCKHYFAAYMQISTVIETYCDIITDVPKLFNFLLYEASNITYSQLLKDNSQQINISSTEKSTRFNSAKITLKMAWSTVILVQTHVHMYTYLHLHFVYLLHLWTSVNLYIAYAHKIVVYSIKILSRNLEQYYSKCFSI